MTGIGAWVLLNEGFDAFAGLAAGLAEFRPLTHLRAAVADGPQGPAVGLMLVAGERA